MNKRDHKLSKANKKNVFKKLGRMKQVNENDPSTVSNPRYNIDCIV